MLAFVYDVINRKQSKDNQLVYLVLRLKVRCKKIHTRFYKWVTIFKVKDIYKRNIEIVLQSKL